MKQLNIVFLLVLLSVVATAQTPKTILLNQPNLERGVPVMSALQQRATTRVFNKEPISLQDLSDMLWAANGINRPNEGKRTAATAMNAQDIDVYVFTQEGAYLYDAKGSKLNLVVEGYFFQPLADRQAFVMDASLVILLVSDLSRFRTGSREQKLEWAALDAGIVAQNIMIFCASEGFATVARSYMQRDKIAEILGLNQDQIPLLNFPVSYLK